MEAVLIPFSAEQSVSPYQQMKRQSRSLKTQNLPPTTVHGGLLNFPPPSVAFHSHQKQQFSNNHHHHHRHRRHHQQPPLLPLPHRSFPPPATTGVPPSCHQKGIRSRDQSLTPKKSKSIKRSREPGVHDKKPPGETTAEFVIVDSTNRLGPEPSHVPKDVWRVLALGSSPPCEGMKSLGGTVAVKEKEKEMEMEFSGSAFSVSPPPSSVPLPKFSLRRKLSCNVEGAGVDAGATDNLRRLLRLR